MAKNGTAHGSSWTPSRSKVDSFAQQGGELGLLAEFCRQALERGNDHRIHPFGLALPDISNYFPVAAFAPERPESWEQLRDEARASLGRRFTGTAFKKWLRDHRDVRISVATIEQAATHVERPPEIDQLIELCRHTSHLRTAR